MAITKKFNAGSNRVVHSVSGLNRSARRLLEDEFNSVYVEGEISNFARPSSGHWYFTLKDDQAQLRCAMFRNRNQRLRFSPENGSQIVVRGKVSLYEGRGDFQLIAEHMEEAGDGALRRAFEKLKASLEQEGLFDAAIKKPLPTMPQHVAIITSATGAAIHDVLTVIQRRFPAINLSILPVQVQGEVSPAQIANALSMANAYQHRPFDVILLTRGGGSLEDLWSFNTEIVARAIAQSTIPVVSAIGHESDVTISDYIADLRAPTPSAAAELITPDIQEWQARLQTLHEQLHDQVDSMIEQHKAHLGHIAKRMRHPGQRLQDLQQRLDDLEIRLRNNLRYQLGKVNLEDLVPRLHKAMVRILERFTANVEIPNKRLESLMKQKLEIAGADFRHYMQQLNALSPLATLDRGFAIVSNNDQIIKDATSLQAGDLIEARLAKGKIQATVNRISDKESS